MAHRFDVDHQKTKRGNYWRILCRDCPWRGTRITNPSIVQSKKRWEEWQDHFLTTLALDEEE